MEETASMDPMPLHQNSICPSVVLLVMHCWLLVSAFAPLLGADCLTVALGCPVHTLSGHQGPLL